MQAEFGELARGGIGADYPRRPGLGDQRREHFPQPALLGGGLIVAVQRRGQAVTAVAVTQPADVGVSPQHESWPPASATIRRPSRAAWIAMELIGWYGIVPISTSGPDHWG